jgi:hypothetical protein
MTGPPILPDLDCFATVRELTDLLIGKGLTDTERREVIEKTRVQFNEAYKDVIEELLGLQLRRLERAQTAEVRDTIEDVASDPGWQEARAAAPVVERSHLWVDPISRPDGTPVPNTLAGRLATRSDDRFGVSAFAVRRFTYNGQTYTDLTIRVEGLPADGITPQQLARLRDNAKLGAAYVSSPEAGLTLPPEYGRLHVTVLFDGPLPQHDQGEPHLTVELADDNRPMSQHLWQVSAGWRTWTPAFWLSCRGYGRQSGVRSHRRCRAAGQRGHFHADGRG